MILRQLSLSWLLIPAVLAEWDCILSRDRLHWDFTHLTEKTMSWTQHTPPSSATSEVKLDLCKPLADEESIPDTDKCPPGTRVCLRTTNFKEGVPDRVTRVVPIAGDISTDSYTSTLTPEFTGGSQDNSKTLTLTLHGPAYPPAPHEPSTPQLVVISFHCSDTDHDPTAINYDSTKGTLFLDWQTKAGCAQKGAVEPSPDDGGDGGSRSGGGGGVGWFFFFLFLIIGAYFGIGAYYNYTQYGASGWDLLPHRDFWRDVPYLLRDMASHLCSTIRPGGSRGGYTSV